MEVHQQQNNYNQQFYPASSCQENYIQSGTQRINQQTIFMQQSVQTPNLDYSDSRQLNSINLFVTIHHMFKTRLVCTTTTAITCTK